MKSFTIGFLFVIGCLCLLHIPLLLNSMRKRYPFTSPNAQSFVPALQRQESALLKALRYTAPSYGIAAVGAILFYSSGSVLSLWDLSMILFYLTVFPCWLYAYVLYVRVVVSRAQVSSQ